MRIKICGITNPEDAFAVVDFGADAIGFVFHPESPRFVTPDTAKTILSALPPFITCVGVFVDRDKSEVEKIARDVGLDSVQFHGSETPDDCKISKKAIKAIRVKDLADLEPLKKYRVSAFLLDTYAPDAIGGTGQVFNWDIALKAKNFGRIILAGGLTPENIGKAIKWVRPYGVDVSTGVESSIKGKKDHRKLKLFIDNARKAGME